MAKRCWLMKSEPESFGIHDLERVQIEPWTGVRNFQARNFMRDDMQVGDDVLFYHSNADPSGVAGLARVHRTAVVDDTQFEPSSKYYDPKARRDAPIWICVEVAYIATLPRLLSLDDLRAEPRLADLVVLRRGSRLSVQPVTPEQFALIAAMGQSEINPASISRAPGVPPKAKVKRAPKSKSRIKPRARAAKPSASAARTRR